MPTTQGYAVKRNGMIDVRTVSATQRAAKVNYLVLFMGMVVLWEADDEIEQRGLMAAGPYVELVEVEIAEVVSDA